MSSVEEEDRALLRLACCCSESGACHGSPTFDEARAAVGVKKEASAVGSPIRNEGSGTGWAALLVKRCHLHGSLRFS
jgi:hypothetical protein